ncbi:hypothetical protein RND71_036354 [Anisodus tanguticus]|uniref:Uncharacterized protein n=1 Tax=Anisodus tanguticus TaxID=243964 RepID=A0AAE1R0Y2_9SOLA|nr:hypothetical protein RND71_036354 [Anisodus tanguticus]
MPHQDQKVSRTLGMADYREAKPNPKLALNFSQQDIIREKSEFSPFIIIKYLLETTNHFSRYQSTNPFDEKSQNQGKDV